MDDSDEALMARIARGDERAFRALASRHLPVMLGLARRILGNAADAEDVAQEAMLRVWTHGSRWKSPARSSIRRLARAKRLNATSASGWSQRRSPNCPRASARRSCLLTATA